MAELSRLIGDISHDIKNMLTPVQMGLSLLEDELNEFFRRPPSMDGEVEETDPNRLYRCDYYGSGEAADVIQERVKEIAEAVKGRSNAAEF